MTFLSYLKQCNWCNVLSLTEYCKFTLCISTINKSLDGTYMCCNISNKRYSSLKPAQTALQRLLEFTLTSSCSYSCAFRDSWQQRTCLVRKNTWVFSRESDCHLICWQQWLALYVQGNFHSVPPVQLTWPSADN